MATISRDEFQGRPDQIWGRRILTVIPPMILKGIPPFKDDGNPATKRRLKRIQDQISIDRPPVQNQIGLYGAVNP
jgi:hypothetical protein